MGQQTICILELKEMDLLSILLFPDPYCLLQTSLIPLSPMRKKFKWPFWTYSGISVLFSEFFVLLLPEYANAHRKPLSLFPAESDILLPILCFFCYQICKHPVCFLDCKDVKHLQSKNLEHREILRSHFCQLLSSLLWEILNMSPWSGQLKGGFVPNHRYMMSVGRVLCVAWEWGMISKRPLMRR